jgi:sugar phosphate permease
MITGLLLQAVIGFIMSGAYAKLTNNIAAFAVVYGLFLSFGELGPGNCLGLLASKTSPTAVRGQYYGAAAAIGKVGAFIGTWAFPPIIDAFGGPSSNRGNTGPFWIGSGLAILSALITFFFIQPVTADGMEAEDREFREYLSAHGYDTTAMGLPETSTEVSSIEENVNEKNLDA